ncbi:hydrolase [Sedimenticola selenatireducens]|uniref:Hydrolase n=1 Tax=Sedimenticola selenatireducens TaxID=191960 RepID=A0A557SEQ2_9GAMM|nr:hydrolase [Sedimenticola selenatireducens]TVO75841.1 hydrolase [Sedimenticola selenatireducens]TVT63700.1 MAG: hydrolase [Sedimenticola selenatireducens]
MIRNSAFKPAWWLSNPHAQTVWPFLFRRRPEPNTRTESVELPDGDFLDIAWLDNNAGPFILIMHGLEGSLQSHYAANLLMQLDAVGYSAVFMHFRGCGGRPNRKDRSYHSGDTKDFSFMLDYIERKSGRSVDAAIGYSLGGNVLLKWLGETGTKSKLTIAIAISVPFLLGDTATRLEKGVSKLYQAHLLSSLKRSYKQRFKDRPSPLTIDIEKLKTFREYDDQVTAPLNGFRGVDHYYSESSSRQYLKNIQSPTLILHAKDDPFMWPTTIPTQEELSEYVTLELTKGGGHVGFVSGTIPGLAHYWLEKRIIEELQLHMPINQNTLE